MNQNTAKQVIEAAGRFHDASMRAANYTGYGGPKQWWEMLNQYDLRQIEKTINALLPEAKQTLDEHK